MENVYFFKRGMENVILWHVVRLILNMHLYNAKNISLPLNQSIILPQYIVTFISYIF